MPAAPAVSRHLLPATLALGLFAATGSARAEESATPSPAGAPTPALAAPPDGPALDSLRRTAPRPDDDEGSSTARMLLFFGLGWVAASALRRRR